MAAIAGMVGLLAWLYAPVGSFPFVTFDDPEYVARNLHVRGGLTWSGVLWAFSTPHAANWHPLTWLSHMVDWSLFGAWAGGHHLTSVVLHIATMLILFGTLVRATGAPLESALATAIVALHPLRVESVAWVSERKDVLCALGWVCGMFAWVRYAQAPSWRRYAGVVVASTAALLAKPMAVTFPFALLLLDVWPLERVKVLGWWQVVREKIPLIGSGLVVAIVTLRVQAGAGAMPSLEDQPLADRVANATVACVKYLEKTIWPADLAVFYPPVTRAPVDVAGAAVLLIAVTFVVLRQRVKRPEWAVGWLWFLGTLVPVLGIVRAGDQAMADRFTYLPAIGLAMPVAFAAGSFARRGRGALAAVVVVVVVVLSVWSMRTHAQVAVWRDSRTLYAQALSVTPQNHLALGNYGLLLLEDGRVDEAVRHFEAAVAVRPSAPKAHLNLGVGLAALGRPAEALREYETAVRLDPRLPVAHFNLARALASAGRMDDAIAHYEEAIRLDPDYGLPHVNLGLLLAQRGGYDEAIAHYRRAIAIDPQLYAAYNNLALALEQTGAIDEAVATYQTLIRMQPQDPRPRFNLGAVFLARGMARDAVEQYQEVVRLDPDLPEAGAALAAARAALDQTSEPAPRR